MHCHKLCIHVNKMSISNTQLRKSCTTDQKQQLNPLFKPPNTLNTSEWIMTNCCLNVQLYEPYR